MSFNITPSVFTDRKLSLDPLGLEAIPEDSRQPFLRFGFSNDNQALLPLKDTVKILQLNSLAILPVPDMPNWLVGVCNWCGDILWLVDFNILMGEASLSHTIPVWEKPMAIVIESGGRSIGLAVEQIGEIELLEPESIHQPQDFYSPILAPLIAGYLPEHRGIILDAKAVIERSLQASL